MDFPTDPEVTKRRRLRRATYVGLALALVTATSVGVSRLRPAPPTVERATVWVDGVKRGPLLIEVRGLGTLVPEEILWIPAATDGRVERRRVLPGTAVHPDMVLVELTTPELEQSAIDAEWQLRAAEAQLNSLKAQLESQHLDQEAAAATVKAEYRQAELNAAKDQRLVGLGLGSELNAKLSEAKAEGLTTRYQLEQQRLAVTHRSAEAQIAAQSARVEQLRALYNLKRSQLDSLRVRAGIEGVLQDLPVEVGQRVTPGTILAKVVQPSRLKAQLKIAETQAKDVQLGQKAQVDTHNSVIPARVIRIDPAVQNGTVTVDVKLDGPLPKGARPDMSVDGTIEIERLADVLYLGWPAFGQPNSAVSVFKIIGGGKEAVRVPVRIGRASVSSVEILGGLNVGDEVILSDMSRWDGFDRVRLE